MPVLPELEFAFAPKEAFTGFELVGEPAVDSPLDVGGGDGGDDPGVKMALPWGDWPDFEGYLSITFPKNLERVTTLNKQEKER